MIFRNVHTFQFHTGTCYVEDGSDDGGNDGGDGGDNGTGDGGKPATVPLAALEAERAKRQDMATRLAKFEADAETAATAAAAKRGEFEQLYKDSQAKNATLTETNNAHAARETARLERVTAANTAAVEALPEEFQALVPDGLDADQQATQIARLSALAGQDNRPRGTYANGKGKAPAVEIPEACKAEAQRRNMTAERWYPHWLKTTDGKEWAKANSSQ